MILKKSHYVSFEGDNLYESVRDTFELADDVLIPPHIQLGATYQFDRVNFDKRGQSLLAHITRLHLIYMYNTKLSVCGFVQYNNIARGIVSNFRLRYNINEGHDFYIVYDETINLDRFRETPYLPKYKNRTILLKYLYTLRR